MRRVLAFLVIFAVLLFGVAARADDADAARAHFSAGVRMYDAHEYTGALAEFQAAYAVRHSPQIKRNIALCLKGLGRYPEAIDALEEMLAEGGDALKPEVRDGAKQAIAEMSVLVATVHVHIVSTGHTPPAKVTITVDDRAVDPARLTRPLHLVAGDHVFTAAAGGYYDATTRARLAAGQPDVAIELGLVAVEVLARGHLTVQTNVMTARVAIDGVEVGVGSWAGDVPAGAHRIDVSAQAYAPHESTVTVPANDTLTVAVDMTSAVAASPEVVVPRQARLWFISGGLGIFGQSLTPTAALDADGTTKRSFGGAALIVHGGRALGKHLTLGLAFEVGGLGTSSYDSATNGGTNKDTITLTNWMLAPELRIRTAGKFRGFGGVAIGLDGQSVSAKLPQGPSGGERQEKGSSLAGIALFEAGGQLDIGRAFLEASLFVDVHGVGTTSDTGSRYFVDSPVGRAGLRLQIGTTF